MRLHPEDMAKNWNPGHPQKRRQRRCRQLQADLQPAGSVHVIRYDTIRTSRSVLAQKATSRPGWVSPEPPDGGSLNGVQSIRTALSGVGCNICTPQQLTSRKPSTASSILPCGHGSSTTASNPHMWNFCKTAQQPTRRHSFDRQRE